ncbi:MAG: hypothetical protein OXG07_02125 [Anaerolineaceae bacterium]|nr:hypothetical protein [Anaerolineaceae bacterium]
MDFNEFADKSIGLVYEVLLRVAKERKTITYRELAHEADVPDAEKPYIWFSYLPGVLDEINVMEVEAGVPLLSAVVVRKEDGLPGDGFFFNLTARPHLVPAGATEEEKRAVHKEELLRVYEAWTEIEFSAEYKTFAEKHHLAVHKVLVDTASKGETITYSDLSREANIPVEIEEMCNLSELLFEINLSESRMDWPMLSAVVMDKAHGLPSLKFFRQATILGKLESGADKESRLVFWNKEVQQVHTAWANAGRLQYQEFANEYRDYVYEILADIATKGLTITHEELAQKASLPAGMYELRLLSALLYEINSLEKVFESPMLSAVLVQAKDGRPRGDFYSCALALNRLPSGASQETKETFWANELKRVHDDWSALAEQEEEGEA